MLIYVDSSSLLKRVLNEADAERLRLRLSALVGDGHELVSSSLAWVEVSRAIRQVSTLGSVDVPADALDTAMSGVAERPLTVDVLSLARRVGGPTLRSLDALHLATAVILDADLVITHDQRLAAAAAELDLRVETP